MSRDSACLSVIETIREDNYRPKLEAAGRQYCFNFDCFVHIPGEMTKVTGNWE
jgi:hypothetical protein